MGGSGFIMRILFYPTYLVAPFYSFLSTCRTMSVRSTAITYDSSTFRAAIYSIAFFRIATCRATEKFCIHNFICFIYFPYSLYGLSGYSVVPSYKERYAHKKTRNFQRILAQRCWRTQTEEYPKARDISQAFTAFILLCLIVAKLSEQKNKAITLFQYVKMCVSTIRYVS